MLLERGHRVTIICRPGSPLAQKCGTVDDSGFRFFTVRMENPLSLPAFISLRRLIRKVRPDILHTHSSIDSWLVSFVGALLRIPIVRSRHVSIPIKNYFPNNQLYSFFPRRIITSGDAISEIVGRLTGVQRRKVISVPAGVDFRRFDCNISGDSIRKELKLTGQPLIGKIGVLRGWKGHDYFLEAVPLILREFPDARFVIVGTGPGYDEIKEKVRTRGLADSVTLLGHRDDVPEITAALDVQVLASFAGEGTPQVIAQAFAMQTPMVATRTGSIPDLLDNGERGVLVEPKDGRSLADGVIKILQDPNLADRLTENAYAFCCKELTIEQMIDRTLAVYKDALTSPS